jgi:hypothetical protein
MNTSVIPSSYTGQAFDVQRHVVDGVVNEMCVLAVPRNEYRNASDHEHGDLP